MELGRTKTLPGWYQRFVSGNRQSKTASQMSFKQYCMENETRMKILYPFLPHEQVKGKLLARWKKSQSREHDSSAKTAMKTKTKMFKPSFVVFGPPRGGKKQLDGSTTTTDRPVSTRWLECTDESKFQDPKTYQGRNFVLSSKVPEVISEPSYVEKSILKNGRAASTISEEKRQPASQVSFKQNDQEIGSPSLYSPPTPFVLSPAGSDTEQLENDRSPRQNRPEKADLFHTSKTIRNTSSSKSQMLTGKGVGANGHTSDWHCTRKTRQATALQKQDRFSSSSLNTKQKTTMSAVKKQNNSCRTKLFQKLTPTRMTKVRSRIGTPNKLPGKRTGSACQGEETIPSSQYSYLEPPKFGSVVHETPTEEKKRFCLFEDESIRPKTPERRYVSQGPKAAKTAAGKGKKKHYSWSPTLGCSQQTPKLKKSKHSLFSESKPETYQQRSRRTAISENKRQLNSKQSLKPRDQRKGKKTSDIGEHFMENDEQYHAPSLSMAAKELRGGTRRKSPRIKGFRPTDQPNHDNATGAHQNILDLASIGADLNISDSETKLSEEVSDDETNQFGVAPDDHISFTQPSQNMSPAKTDRYFECRKSSRNRTNTIPSSNMGSSAETKTGPDGPVAEKGHLSLTQRRNCPKKKENLPKPSIIIQHANEDSDIESSRHGDPVHTEKSGQRRTVGLCPDEIRAVSAESREGSPSSCGKPGDQSLFARDPPVDDNSLNVVDETSVFRRILFQLKNTASSQSVLQSSPAQSRLSEVSLSEMSAKNPCSDAPSPASETDLFNELEVCRKPASRKTSERIKTSANMDSERTYRKRGNILCNLFEASDGLSAPSVPQTRRYIPSDTCLESRDFSTLFSTDDVF